jgi:integrase
MGHQVNRLNAKTVETTSKPGIYPDGAGLYLRVGRGGAKSWCLRYMLKGKAREMGLGGISKVSLADARKRASAHRLLLADKIDPLDRREAESRAQRVAAGRSKTFAECAAAYIKAHEADWRNAKHRQQWENTIVTYANPILGSLPVGDITRSLVLEVLRPIWSTKPETARRLRARIEAVLDFAEANEYRPEGTNPVRRQAIKLALGSQADAVKHHAALPYLEAGAFMVDLRTRQGAAADALEFLILTVARTGEVIGARWPEIDLAGRIWSVPAARMKGNREHRVPLTSAAIAVLERMRAQGEDFVFPGARAGQGLSNMALLKVLERMGRGDVTTHGFRATFKTWASERTSFPRELAEAALAHVLDDKTEAAYQRGDLLEKRRRLMDAWAEVCGKPAPAGTVVNLRQA